MQLADPSLIKTGLLLNGVWLQKPDIGLSGSASAEVNTSVHHFVVTNPANLKDVAWVNNASAADAEQAIVHAVQAQSLWQQQLASERALLLKNWYQLVLQHQHDLALILATEQGKPLAEANAEIGYAASFIEWFAEEAKRLYGDLIPTTAQGRRLLTIKQPVGVVAAITPWNFPAAMVTRKLAPALAAGCTVILKPSELTPLTALALGELAQRAGFPPGVLQMLPTKNAAAVAQVLCQSPMVRKLTFTGSTSVGKLLMRQCADTVKRLSLELGGNAPVLVFADADLSQAVAGVMAAKFRNAGQTCVCINRIYVERCVYERFNALLFAEIQQLKLGDALTPGVQIGPLINAAAVHKVSALVQDAVTQGARLHCGGQQSELGPHFYQPTLLTEVTPQMQLMQQEIFGPVAAVMPFDNEQQAIDLANQSAAGLAAYLYSSDIGRLWRLAEALEVGMVGINETAISTEVIPFGGVKESGLGREGSRYGMDEYLEIKHLCWGGLAQS